MAQSGTIGNNATTTGTISTSRRARGILDLSGTKLVDRPQFLEEKLRKTRGIFDAEINAFSNRMTVEFDPSLITLDKIKVSLVRRNASKSRQS
jgi:hypothetical protein